MSGAMSNLEQEHSSVHIIEDDSVMEEMDPTLVQSDEKTEEEAAAHSPLNKYVPKMSTEKVQPLVSSFWDKVETLNMADREHKKILAEIFMDVIATIANLILDALRNLVLEGSERQGPLLVSEEAISSAFHSSLVESFTTVTGSTHNCMSELLRLLCTDVTAHINSALKCSRLKGKHLRVAKESDYRPPKVRLKAMIRHTRDMLRSIQEKVTPGCMRQIPREKDSAQAETDEEAPPRRLQPIKQKLARSCFPYGSGQPSEEKQEVTAEVHTPSSNQVAIASLSSSHYPPSSSLTEEDDVIKKIVPSPVHSGSVQILSEQQEEIERSQHRPKSKKEQPRGSTKLHSIGSRVSRLCPLSCACYGKGTDSVSISSTESSSTSSSLIVREATENLRDILLNEAVDLSEGDRNSLSDHSLEVASSIITYLMDGMGRLPGASKHPAMMEEQYSTPPPNSGCLTGVTTKIKAFFTLCYTKVSLRRLLSQLCSRDTARTSVNLEEVMENVSPLLQKMVKEEGDVYETLSKSIALGQQKELSEKLTDVISTNIARTKDKPQFTREVRAEIRTFMTLTSHWLQRQMQLPSLRDPVQRVLARIHRLVFRVTAPPQSTQGPLMLTGLEKRPVLHSPQTFEHVSFSDKQEEAPEVIEPIPSVHTLPHKSNPVTTPGVDMGPMSAKKALPGQWAKDDVSNLVCEVVSRIFQKKWRPNRPEMVAFSRELQLKMMEQVSNWDILVKPSKGQYSEVADAVYRNLCKGTKRLYVTHAAVTLTGFSSQVIDTIKRHLEMPAKKHTLGSVLHSVWGTLYRR